MCSKTSLGAVLLMLCLVLGSVMFAIRQRTRDGLSGLSRRRRGVVYVQGSILQFAFGLQVPTGIPNRMVNINVGLQANYMLPSNASQFHRARRCDRGADLRDTYTQIEELLEQQGFSPGRDCLLRSICEAAGAPFAESLLEEIARVILTPSWDPSAAEGIEMGEQYFRAELLGRTNGSCHKEFPACNITPLQLVSDFVM
ncbi:uncharacterized protein LOC134529153 isoform X2 [Bacillus rossius redtenbacheri]|uniref:uncharacterized protein LOC134529153 isoform X2 n=1 Tax=Bacillus rossius redtenbacheri TaxID=93214 RepID=UPI002FDE6769